MTAPDIILAIPVAAVAAAIPATLATGAARAFARAARDELPHPRSTRTKRSATTLIGWVSTTAVITFVVTASHPALALTVAMMALALTAAASWAYLGMLLADQRPQGDQAFQVTPVPRPALPVGPDAIDVGPATVRPVTPVPTSRRLTNDPPESNWPDGLGL